MPEPLLQGDLTTCTLWSLLGLATLHRHQMAREPCSWQTCVKAFRGLCMGQVKLQAPRKVLQEVLAILQLADASHHIAPLSRATQQGLDLRHLHGTQDGVATAAAALDAASRA